MFLTQGPCVSKPKSWPDIYIRHVHPTRSLGPNGPMAQTNVGLVDAQVFSELVQPDGLHLYSQERMFSWWRSFWKHRLKEIHNGSHEPSLHHDIKPLRNWVHRMISKPWSSECNRLKRNSSPACLSANGGDRARRCLRPRGHQRLSTWYFDICLASRCHWKESQVAKDQTIATSMMSWTHTQNTSVCCIKQARCYNQLQYPFSMLLSAHKHTKFTQLQPIPKSGEITRAFSCLPCYFSSPTMYPYYSNSVPIIFGHTHRTYIIICIYKLAYVYSII